MNEYIKINPIGAGPYILSADKGNLSAGSAKISIGGTGTGAVIGVGASVDLGTVNLDDLANVSVPSPSLNDVLTWSGTAWINSAPVLPDPLLISDGTVGAPGFGLTGAPDCGIYGNSGGPSLTFCNQGEDILSIDYSALNMSLGKGIFIESSLIGIGSVACGICDSTTGLDGAFGTGEYLSLVVHLDEVGRFDESVVAGDTRLLLWDVDTGALVRVSVGADNSGGTGYKVLRIPN